MVAEGLPEEMSFPRLEGEGASPVTSAGKHSSRGKSIHKSSEVGKAQCLRDSKASAELDLTRKGGEEIISDRQTDRQILWPEAGVWILFQVL